MDYQIAPLPDNETERLAALRLAMCAYVPREDRFDRITRTVQRLMHVPIAMITIVEKDVRWLRSSQGVTVPEAPRDSSICSHAILSDGVFQVNDAKLDPRFENHPSVIGYPFVRSYCGWPLELAPGLRVGTLCVLDTLPRYFGEDDLEIMSDLARMVEAELRVNTMSDHQKSLMVDLSIDQRKSMLDPLTGSWSELGFDNLVDRTKADVAAGKVFSALCAIKVLNVNDFDIDAAHPVVASNLRSMLISQAIRQRLPANAVLCRLPDGYACTLLAAHDKDLLNKQLNAISVESTGQAIEGVAMTQKLSISTAIMHLAPADISIPASDLRSRAMAKFLD